MGRLMASVDASEEIKNIQLRLGMTEQSVERQEKTLEKCVDILGQVVKVAEKQNYLQQQLDEHREHYEKERDKLEASVNTRFEKISDRVEKNSRQVLLWTGGIGAVLTLITVLAQFGSLVKVITH